MQPDRSTDRSLSRRGAAVAFACAVAANLAVAGLVVGWRAPASAPAPALSPSAWLRQPGPNAAALRDSVTLIAFLRPGDQGAGALVSRLTAWHHRYHGAGLQVVGVCLVDPGATVDRGVVGALFGRDPAFPVAIDTELACARGYGVRTSPALVAVDRSGRIRSVFDQAGRWDDVQPTLSALLAEPAR